MRKEHMNVKFDNIRFNILNDDMLNIKIELLNRPHWSIRQQKTFVKKLNKIANDYEFNVKYYNEPRTAPPEGRSYSDEIFTHNMAVGAIELNKMLRQMHDKEES